MELLKKFVNGSIDLLFEVQGDLDEIVFDDVNQLSESANKLREMKSKLEGKLAEFREVIYLGKYVSQYFI